MSTIVDERLAIATLPAPASAKPDAAQKKPSGAPAGPAGGSSSAPAVTPARGFALRVDEQTHEVIAVEVDPQTRAVIREIPPEEMRVASDVIRNLIGRLVDRIV
jgi:hypothetical protein